MGEEMAGIRCGCGWWVTFPEAQRFSSQPVCPKCGEVAPLQVELDEGYSTLYEVSAKVYVSPSRLRDWADRLEKARPTKLGERILLARLRYGSVYFIWKPTN